MPRTYRLMVMSCLMASMSAVGACSGNGPSGQVDAGTKQSSMSSHGGSGTTANAGAAGRSGAPSANGKAGATGNQSMGTGGTRANTMGTGGASVAGGAGAAGIKGGAGESSVSSSTKDGGVIAYGQAYQGGQFHLGPVDYDETQWHNACAPSTKYAPAIRTAEGTLLAGLWNGIPNVASYCDACISVTTAKGKSAILRVVTYGDTTMNSIDVSPEAYAILNSGEYPRAMSWQFAACPDTGKIVYEFQTGSSEWWTSLWVRNGRLPITKVEVMSPNHTSYAALARGSDGTLTDDKGFGKGPFTLRLMAIDGQTLTDTFDWPAAGIAGQVLTSQGNFR